MDPVALVCGLALYLILGGITADIGYYARSGKSLGPSPYDFSWERPPQEEYDRERILGSRIMLGSIVWPLLWTYGILWWTVKGVKFLAINVWKPFYNLGILIKDATKRLPKEIEE